MTERTILEWEDQIYEDQFIRSTSKGKGHQTWGVSIWSSSKVGDTTYCLSVGEILIIKAEIQSIEEAKQMAQGLQDVLDSNGPIKKLIDVQEKIQAAIDNIRRFQRDAGTSRSINENYEDGRADAYIIVLGWMDE